MRFYHDGINVLMLLSFLFSAGPNASVQTTERSDIGATLYQIDGGKWTGDGWATLMYDD